jgi:hypothetical protein
VTARVQSFIADAASFEILDRRLVAAATFGRLSAYNVN